MITQPAVKGTPVLPAHAKRSPVNVGFYEIGDQEVEVRLYSGPMEGAFAAIVCHNWRVLSLASGYSEKEVIASALEKAKEKIIL